MSQSSSAVDVNQLRANLPLTLTPWGQEKVNFHFGVSVTMICMSSLHICNAVSLANFFLSFFFLLLILGWLLFTMHRRRPAEIRTTLKTIYYYYIYFVVVVVDIPLLTKVFDRSGVLPVEWAGPRGIHQEWIHVWLFCCCCVGCILLSGRQEPAIAEEHELANVNPLIDIALPTVLSYQSRHHCGLLNLNSAGLGLRWLLSLTLTQTPYWKSPILAVYG